MNFLRRFESFHPLPDELELGFTGQAGLLVRDADGVTVGVDLYLGNGCEAAFGFRRLIPPPLSPTELHTDYLVATHSHMDHLDPEVIRIVAPRACCIAARDCRPALEQAGCAPESLITLSPGESYTRNGLGFRAVRADHGELAPEAIGMLFSWRGITIYLTGDTAYRPAEIAASLGDVEIDVMCVPINPAFGNPGAEDAARLGALVHPRALAGVHCGMFAEHGGDPAAFLREAAIRLPARTAAVIVPAAGSLYRYRRAAGLREIPPEASHV